MRKTIRSMTTATILAGVFVWATQARSADGPPPAANDKGLRVFMTGHSFHMPMQGALDEVAKAAGLSEHTIVGTQGLGGSRVIQIWDIPDEKNSAKRALTAG